MLLLRRQRWRRFPPSGNLARPYRRDLMEQLSKETTNSNPLIWAGCITLEHFLHQFESVRWPTANNSPFSYTYLHSQDSRILLVWADCSRCVQTISLVFDRSRTHSASQSSCSLSPNRLAFKLPYYQPIPSKLQPLTRCSSLNDSQRRSSRSQVNRITYFLDLLWFEMIC